MVLIPSPRHKLSHLLGPPHPLERDVLYGRPFSTKALYCTYKIILHKDIYVQYTFNIYIYIYIKYVTLYFWPISTPLSLSHFVTHPWTPRKYVTHLGPPAHFSYTWYKNPPP